MNSAILRNAPRHAPLHLAVCFVCLACRAGGRLRLFAVRLAEGRVGRELMAPGWVRIMMACPEGEMGCSCCFGRLSAGWGGVVPMLWRFGGWS